MANMALLWLLRLSATLWTGSGVLRVTEAVSEAQRHRIEDWIHLEAIQLLVHHASAVITALVLSALVVFVIERLMREGPVRRLIILIDEIFVALLIVFFVGEAVLSFWHK